MRQLLLCVLLMVGATSASDDCYHKVSLACATQFWRNPGKNLVLPTCNAIYGAFRNMESYGENGPNKDYTHTQVVINEMQLYAHMHIARSYEFLLSSAFYNNYKTNRGGFAKLFKKMSDQAWQDAIELIKHINKRGGEMDFHYYHSRSDMNRNSTVELYELGSLAKALDVQKELAERAFSIHREATRNRLHEHDAEISHFLEEEFIEKQADTIRTLAGHTTDVKKFIADKKGQDMSMALYLFDSYLSKVV